MGCPPKLGAGNEAARVHHSYWLRGGDAARGSGTAERADSTCRRDQQS